MGTVHDITPHRLAADLRDSAARLDTLSRRIRSTARDAATAEVAYRTAQAKARLIADGKTVDLRDAQVVLAVHDEMLAAHVARADAEAARVDSSNLRSLISAAQSQLQLARLEAGLSNVPGMGA